MRGVISTFAVAAAVLFLAAGSAAAATCRTPFTVSYHVPDQGLRHWTVVRLYATGIGCTEARDLVYFYLGHHVKPAGYECRYAGMSFGTPSDPVRASFLDCRLASEPKTTLFAEYAAGAARVW